MFLADYNYIIIPEPSDIITMARELLCRNGKTDTYTHVCAVAEQNVKIAEAFGLDVRKCYLSGILHDISAVMKPGDMLGYSKSNSWHTCEAEERYPFLLHQRLSAVIAEELFGVDDENITNPIRCHTTLRADASDDETALFIADKLAWDQGGKPPFYDNVTKMLEISLQRAAYEYMTYMTENHKVLFAHDDWNSAMQWLSRT